MRCFAAMFVTVVSLSFQLKLIWPKNNSECLYLYCVSYSCYQPVTLTIGLSPHKGREKN